MQTCDVSSVRSSNLNELPSFSRNDEYEAAESMGFLSRVVAPLYFAYDSTLLNKPTALKKRKKRKYIPLQFLGFFGSCCCDTYSKTKHKTILLQFPCFFSLCKGFGNS